MNLAVMMCGSVSIVTEQYTEFLVGHSQQMSITFDVNYKSEL